MEQVHSTKRGTERAWQWPMDLKWSCKRVDGQEFAAIPTTKTRAMLHQWVFRNVGFAPPEQRGTATSRDTMD